MSSCDNPNYELAVINGYQRRELSLFEEEDFCPESYVLSRLCTVEEEEETPWKSAAYQKFCTCVKRRQVHHSATNTKNELRVLIAELKVLQRISAKEIIKSMISHYALFIQTSQEVTELEQAILKLRTLLRSRAAVVRSLATMEWTVPAAAAPPLPPHPKQQPQIVAAAAAGCYPGDDDDDDDDPVAPEFENDAKASLPAVFDVLFAERQVDLAISILEQGDEDSTVEYRGTTTTNAPLEGGSLSAGGAPVVTAAAAARVLQMELWERRARVLDYLSEVCQQPSVRGVELRSAIAALNRLGEGARAHTLLLRAHQGRLKHNTHGLRPSGTSSYGGAFTAALSQMTFSAIAQAERDSLKVFGAVPAFASELVVWAQHLTEQCAVRIQQHVLSSAAAAGGLPAAAECVQIALGHCALLEAQGLILRPSLVKVFKPSVEQAMEANLRRIEESVTALAAADDWVPTSNPHQIPPFLNSRRGSLHQANCVKLSCSAHRFNAMAQDFMAGVSPLVSMQLAGVALDGLALRFNKYVDMLIKAVPGTSEVQKEQTARTETQQLALLSNAAALAHELLPRSIVKLLPVVQEPGGGTREDSSDIETVSEDRTIEFIPGLKDWRRKLQKAVKRLQDHVCGYYVKLLLYSEDKHEFHLTPETYLLLDAEGRSTSSPGQEKMPSMVFQSLFFRLNFISEVGKEMAFSSEGVLTSFFARLLEVFISYMDEDNFWSIIEEGPMRIGSIGLKQFVLDMQFVIEMASSRVCGSRLLHSLVPDLTSRAVHAFAATGADPESVLPSDEWFLEMAREAIDKLSEEWNQRSIAQDPVAAAFTDFQEPNTS